MIAQDSMLVVLDHLTFGTSLRYYEKLAFFYSTLMHFYSHKPLDFLDLKNNSILSFL